MNASNPTAPTSLPPLVHWLGYGGLVPFVGLAVLAWMPAVAPIEAGVVLRAYGAAILSFVGALHWGLAMALPGLRTSDQGHLYLWSIVPALLAWVAVLLPAPWGAGLLVTGFVLHYLQDRQLHRRATLPGWYLPLRLRLTGVAVASLLAAGWR